MPCGSARRALRWRHPGLQRLLQPPRHDGREIRERSEYRDRAGVPEHQVVQVWRPRAARGQPAHPGDTRPHGQYGQDPRLQGGHGSGGGHHHGGGRRGPVRGGPALRDASGRGQPPVLPEGERGSRLPRARAEGEAGGLAEAALRVCACVLQGDADRRERRRVPEAGPQEDGEDVRPRLAAGGPGSRAGGAGGRPGKRRPPGGGRPGHREERVGQDPAPEPAVPGPPGELLRPRRALHAGFQDRKRAV
mmetsp:Transcript_25708/g.73443  ORF Transcript_25708/g.73443 Transcript_25708/m.73443 type:complete len:248 (-) Transcript_25708:2959-3702(-)